jgi:CBS domain-containing protein
METLQHQPKDMEALRAFRVRDAMHVGLIKCPRDAPLTDVARLMAVHRVHARERRGR